MIAQRKHAVWPLALLFGIASTSWADSPTPQKYRVYIGTYTGPKSKGIYLLELDMGTGALTSKGLAGESLSPSFLALHPNRRFLYSVNEGAAEGDFSGGGSVSAYEIDSRTGLLTFLNRQSSKGGGPCHLVVDREGKAVLVANYGGGSVAMLPIAEDGKLKPSLAFFQHAGKVADPVRQGGPHAHSINLDAANRFAVAADLGLDKLFVYKFDPAKMSLVANDPPSTSVAPRSGPRHFAFHPDGRHAYVINEISLTVTAFDYDSSLGTLKEIQTISTVPDGPKPGYSTAEVQVHPSGKFLYGSNRGHDTIAIFTIAPETGRLTAVGYQSTGGKTPRNFGIDPTGKYLLAANQDSGTIVPFRIDPTSGRLTPVGGEKIRVAAPVCVKFLPIEP